MIYIIGDRHGEPDGFDRLEGEAGWGKQDIAIVVGDFGYVFLGEQNSEREKQKLDALARKPYQILFCDGNHEGFPYLEEYPEEERFGAPVKKIRDNIFWLRRGYLYTIAEKTFFVMGGAHSMDQGYRLSYEEISGVKIWFEEELPTKEEYHRAIATLEKCHYQVEYILTHTAPRSIIPRLIGRYPDDHDAELTGFLDWIYHDVTFKKWYFGHFHEDVQINDQMIACFEQVHSIP